MTHTGAVLAGALLASALIEREVRAGMRRAAAATIPLYPEFRGCAPSTERIREIFAATSRHHLYRHGALIQTFAPELTDQQQVLDLLGSARHRVHRAAVEPDKARQMS